RVARIAEPVGVDVRLPGVGGQVAVVVAIGDPVVVVVGVAGVAVRVAIGVLLAGIRIEAAVVARIRDAVVVVIGIACVAEAVGVQRLTRDRDGSTEVGARVCGACIRRFQPGVGLLRPAPGGAGEGVGGPAVGGGGLADDEAVARERD